MGNMGHNHAKPAGTAQRLERVLSRLPDDWEVRIERSSVSQQWRALTQAPGMKGGWSGDEPTLIDALESAWRLNRQMPSSAADSKSLDPAPDNVPSDNKNNTGKNSC